MRLILIGFMQAAAAGGDHGPQCSNKTLKGTYRYNMTGSLAAGDGFVPEAYAGFASYDGRGNVVVQKTSRIGSDWGTRDSVGTYEVERGCTAEASFPTAKYDYYIAPDGSSFSYVKVADFDQGKDDYEATGDRLASSAVRISSKPLK